MFLPSTYPRSRSPCLNDSRCGWFREPINRMPILETFFVCCASAAKLSAKTMAHRAKLPSFRLFTSPSRTTVLVLCLNLGNIHLPISAKKQAEIEIVGLSCQCSVLVLALTLNTRVWEFESPAANIVAPVVLTQAAP